MKTKDFDPATMKRATFFDVERMMNKLWGEGARRQYRIIAPTLDDEILDLTQLPLRGGAVEARQSHNLEVASPNLAPASNDQDKDN